MTAAGTRRIAVSVKKKEEEVPRPGLSRWLRSLPSSRCTLEVGHYHHIVDEVDDILEAVLVVVDMTVDVNDILEAVLLDMTVEVHDILDILVGILEAIVGRNLDIQRGSCLIFPFLRFLIFSGDVGGIEYDSDMTMMVRIQGYCITFTKT